jgi:hypothetical protein
MTIHRLRPAVEGRRDPQEIPDAGAPGIVRRLVDALSQISLLGKLKLAYCAGAARHNHGYLLIHCIFDEAGEFGPFLRTTTVVSVA